MKIAIVGTGYVGLVSGVCLAAKGHHATCVDVNPAIVERLNRGEPTIFERGLPELLAEVCASGRFSATTDLTAALADAELVLVAVGTPSDVGAIDLHFIRAACADIGAYLRTADRHLSVVIKSTVVPGTTDTVVREALEQASGLAHGQFGLGMNPEFLREGEAIADFMEPDRIVFGHEDPETLRRLEELYAPWDVDKLAVNTRTAELIKYANNALLATQISMMNEIANLSAAIGNIDALDVVKGVQLDKRWSPVLADGERVAPDITSYLVPGCGFGGSCFPKDLQALGSLGDHRGLPMHMVNAILEVNEAQPAQVGAVLEEELGDLEDKSVLILGLAFKPGTDDVRESASLKIVADLLDRGARLTAHDPVAVDNFRHAMGMHADDITFVEDWRAAVGTAQIIVIATRWPDYEALTQTRLGGKVVFDARRLLSPNELPGARYLSIGRRLF